MWIPSWSSMKPTFIMVIQTKGYQSRSTNTTTKRMFMFMRSWNKHPIDNWLKLCAEHPALKQTHRQYSLRSVDRHRSVHFRLAVSFFLYIQKLSLTFVHQPVAHQVITIRPKFRRVHTRITLGLAQRKTTCFPEGTFGWCVCIKKCSVW